MPNPLYNEVKEDQELVMTPPLQNGMPFLGGTQRISPVSQSVFRNVQTGGQTTTYTIQNTGYFTFGDGSDGATDISSNTTLTSDKYYTDLTIDTGVTLIPPGFRIFCTGTLTMNGTAIIDWSGNNGQVGSGGVGGAGGAALVDGYLKGAKAGGAGGAGQTGAGTAGTTGANTSNSIGSNGVAGGAGGNGTSSGGAAGTGGTATASNVKLIANWHLSTLLDIGATGAPLKFDNSGSGGGGGGGGGTPASGTRGSSGSGAGSGGGIIAIYARNIVIGASAIIRANGGNGANGGTDGSGNDPRGGGGGGAGGNGGQIILVYNTITNNGVLQVNGGTGGTGSAGNGAGATSGANGVNGSAGTIRQFQISL